MGAGKYRRPGETAGRGVILIELLLNHLSPRGLVGLLSWVDASYPLSFFFFMDCIGTLSMITDISWTPVGQVDATKPQVAQNSDTDLTFFRATRTAKIGAPLSAVAAFAATADCFGKGLFDFAAPE